MESYLASTSLSQPIRLPWLAFRKDSEPKEKYRVQHYYRARAWDLAITTLDRVHHDDVVIVLEGQL